jgi:hypothetical protein
MFLSIIMKFKANKKEENQLLYRNWFLTENI